MELELGLSLTLSVHDPVKGFDVNNYGVLKKKGMVGLESKSQVGNKRNFALAFDEKSATAGSESKMVSLSLWSGQPNEEDDEKGQNRRDYFSNITKNDDEVNRVVGWPPIKSWRKKMLYQHNGHDHQYPLQNQIPWDHKEDENDGIPTNSMYVKVKMEGVRIVRKIDIKLHHSYQTLRNTLITMFSKDCNRYEKECGADNYRLTYQDKQGDWQLAADVPWQTFIESVQRLQILRNGA